MQTVRMTLAEYNGTAQPQLELEVAPEGVAAASKKVTVSKTKKGGCC